ncbi:glucose-6-phosphate isomerase [Candidatus Peregrinibacteria bacterium]|nr:glucose-6-phosphate isomerase [Candidatus Peregrinibacteria bacterium]MBT7736129.1 glucose-6-phosphate isomerase [Candidatus Peregrinibacteria bacterium]
MVKFDLSNLHRIAAEHGLSEEELSSKKDQIAGYLEKIEARKQGFYEILDDNVPIKDIDDFALENRGKYNHIVVLGIGGSSLGTICLQQSLTHLYQKTLPELYVLDNIDPEMIKELEDVIDYEKTLFIVVTKSGTTPEILSQYYYFRKNTEEKGLVPKEHFVFVTDPEKGTLREISNSEGIKAFDIPQNVGGRFSVLTPVGLLPAKLIGIDINRLISGAKEMRNQFLSEDFTNNLPFQLAVIQYLLGEKGKVMNVMMPYSQKLIRFADWYRQLLAESIGKKVNNKGETVNVGLTPINALGVTDQHSQSQLYNEGPNDKLIIFIENTHPLPDLKIPELETGDITFKKLLNIELEATATSLTKNDRPNLRVQVDSVTEETLGSLFMLTEGATAFLGELYEIDAFDQPGVELSKDLTRKALS